MFSGAGIVAISERTRGGPETSVCGNHLDMENPDKLFRILHVQAVVLVEADLDGLDTHVLTPSIALRKGLFNFERKIVDVLDFALSFLHDI